MNKRQGKDGTGEGGRAFKYDRINWCFNQIISRKPHTLYMNCTNQPQPFTHPTSHKPPLLHSAAPAKLPSLHHLYLPPSILPPLSPSHSQNLLYPKTTAKYPNAPPTRSPPPSPTKPAQQPPQPPPPKPAMRSTLASPSTPLVLLLLLLPAAHVSAGPISYGTRQAGCAPLVMACYAAAGAIWGATAGVAAGPTIIACNAAWGSCQATCAALLLAPTP